MSNNWQEMPGGDIFPATSGKQRDLLERLVEVLTAATEADQKEIDRLRQEMLRVRHGGNPSGK